MFQYVTNLWYIALVVMVTQFMFLYLRTISIIYIAERKTIKAVLSGVLTGVTWLLSITLSINAINNLEWQPIMGYLIGGALGTYFAMTIKNK